MIKYLLSLLIVGLIVWRVISGASSSDRKEFPNRAIQVVVPYSAGGGTDTFARIISKALRERDELTVPIVIMNQDGGSATIGSRFVKDSKPDGYRILCHHEGIIATKLAGVVPYGAEAFDPIAQTGSIVLLMVVRADSPYQSLTELLEEAQKNPNKIRMGANQGSPAYFICKQLLAEYPGADFNFISAGGSKRVTYLLGNKLDAGIFSLAEYVSFRNSDDVPASDNILAIGNFGEQRHSAIPEVTTSREQGLKTSAENAYYFWAPKETPADVTAKLASAFEAALNDPAVLKEFEKLSLDPKFRSGQELTDHLGKRVAAFEKLAVKADTALPDFAKWMIGIVGGLFALVLAQGFRERHAERRSDTEKESVSEEIAHEGALTNQDSFKVNSFEKPHPKFNRGGILCLAILLGYVAALQLGVPFVVATAIGIFLMGGTISHWDQKRLFALVQISLLFSLSVELVFTKLFTVALP